MLRIVPAAPDAVEALRALDPLAAIGSERADDIVAWVAAGQCHVALEADTIVGYAALSHGFFHQPFIELLMVAAARRRAGIGLALVRHCVGLAPTEKLWTSTNASNLAMQALLAKAGFVPSGRVDNLDPGDPELIFVHLPEVLGQG